ncbi:MAG TPA: radical SAM family heme chaperone HemW [Acidimicrobiia bacterium]|nr:radical SAM family heme chaperone HemW [Acidimicrobiia bacterium]
MTPAEADRFVESAAAYVHIPFCSAVCPYCDFAVVAGQDHLAARYIDAVCTEIGRSRPWRPLDAIYLGGGTPSHVDPVLLGSVLDALADKHGIAPDAEVSLEANPEDFSTGTAAALRTVGFNRVSFGAQSFDPGVLSSLGRRHHASQIVSSFESARAAGFENLSIDLIFGTPGETDESWGESLQSGLRLQPDHVSCYALTVEPGTPLGREVRAGAAGPDPDVQAGRYETADEVLSRAGLARYEVSNWSRPRHECRYNLTVWAQGEYEAYGNGAHGFRRGRRFRNLRRLDAYLDRVEAGRSAHAGEEMIDGWGAELDRLFVGLRRTVGVASGPGTETLLSSEEGRMLVAAGVIAEQSGRMVVGRPLLTDAVHRSVLAQLAPIVGVDGDA